MALKGSDNFSPKDLLRCRLCWRVTLVVLCGILLAEAAIFVPSYRSYERSLLSTLERNANAALTGALGHALSQDQTAERFLENPAGLQPSSRVLGATLYFPDGGVIGSFGEPPVLAPGGARAVRQAGGARYDVIWTPERTGLPLIVAARLDAGWIAPALVAFTWRIAGLVLLILAIVAPVTILTLGLLFFRPMLQLRTHLLAAQSDPANADRHVLAEQRNDELGDTINAVNLLFSRVSNRWRRDLQAREARFRDFADASSDWFWEMDEGLRFSYFSDRFTEITGVPQDALLGKTRQETGISDLDLETWEAHLAALAAHESFRDFTHPRALSDGRTVHLSINGKAIFDDDGAFKGYRGSGSDVTERHKAEEALRELNETLEQRVAEKSTELEEAQVKLLRQERLTALGQVTATVSHELRNPLAAIRNSVFTIGERAEGKGLGIERALERTARNIARCDRIVGELLDYTRESTPCPKPEVLDAWLETVLEEQETPERIALVKELGAPGLELGFDPDVLRRAVINVFDNACQAMAEAAEGAAGEPAPNLTIRTAASDDHAQIYFVDNGPGIAPEHLAKVFEPLYSTKSFGVGLGLPTVKRIMEQHGGGIEVTSEAGRGTTVELWLPLDPAQEDAA